MKKEIKLNLPDELLKKLESKIKSSDFKSLQEYIEFVLEQVVSEESDAKNKEDFFDEDEAKMQEKRLKDLGYM